MFSSIYFKKYKSFSDSDENALLDVGLVNVFIGKNNSGKSSLLDVVEQVINPTYNDRGTPVLPDIEIATQISEEDIDGVVSATYHGVSNLKDTYGWPINAKLDFQKKMNSSNRYEWHFNSRIVSLKNKHPQGTIISAAYRTAYKVNSNLRNSTFKKLAAERNILPEGMDDRLQLDTDGSGASNLIRAFINEHKYDERIIEKELLEALNRITSPDSLFQHIKIQQDDGQVWEIYLQEEGSERFALSQSGSGLKTIILLLLNLLVVPKLMDYKDKTIVYGFEELENNLHPYLQRQIFDYIYDFAIKNNTRIFLTTHSHVAINAFFGKENTALYHITKEKGVSQVYKIDNYIDKVKILDDLDVKASDLLQSNGIIWVEGPSDRIFIKCWLEIFCDCEYEEGEQYQFLYYGGKLLAHYTADEDADGLISVLTTNRNNAIVMDSDIKVEGDEIRATKKRVTNEFEKLGMFSWVTDGKEIENYLPLAAVKSAYPIETNEQCDRLEDFREYMKKHLGTFSEPKVDVALKIKEHITADNSKDILDLKMQIEHLYWKIKSWNE